MKSIAILLFFILAGTISRGQVNTASSGEILKEALAKAADSHKNVLIIFRASWCGWCRKMDAGLTDRKLSSLFDNNYIIVHLTIDETDSKKSLENAGAAELRKKYHGDRQGLPYWFILDAGGNFLADSRLRKSEADPNPVNVGCPASNEEINYFIMVIRRTSSLNTAQLTLIKEWFLGNKE